LSGGIPAVDPSFIAHGAQEACAWRTAAKFYACKAGQRGNTGEDGRKIGFRLSALLLKDKNARGKRTAAVLYQ
jgi:hypothetical protein